MVNPVPNHLVELPAWAERCEGGKGTLALGAEGVPRLATVQPKSSGEGTTQRVETLLLTIVLGKYSEAHPVATACPF
jgi:hypothetical protein